MKHNFKKILSIILVALMCLSMFPIGVFAVEAEMPVCPECLNNTNVAPTGVVVAAPDCRTAAGTWYECSAIHANGAHLQFLDQTAPAHHSNPDKVTHVEAVEPDCDNTGNIEYWYCSECETYYDDEAMLAEDALANLEATVLPVDEDAHNWGEWGVVNAPVCGESDGSKERTCTICGEVDSEVIPGTEHNWVVDSYDATIGCMEDGEVVLKCANDGCTATDTKIGKGWLHELVMTEAKTPTCTEDGNIEYWTCRQCGKYFDSNDEDKVELNANALTLAKTHTLTHHAANAATCTDDGNVEYWTCSGVCGATYLDAAATNVVENADDLVVDAIGHDMTYTPAKNATCEEKGDVAHYNCANCHKNFEDEEGETEILTAVVIEKLNHVMNELKPAEPANCEEGGKIAHKTCQTCDKLFDAADPDDNMTHVLASIDQVAMVPPTDGSTVLVEGEAGGVQHNWQYSIVKEATCELKGAIVWVCADCNDYTGVGKQLAYNIEEIGHKNALSDANAANKVALVEPTCQSAGNCAYVKCPDCNLYLVINADGTLNTTFTYNDTTSFVTPIDSKAHASFTPVAAVEATCGANGNEAYNICDDCGVWFQVENGVVSDPLQPEDVVVSNATHDKTDVAAVAPTSCKVKGNRAYVSCACGKLYETTDTTFTTPKALSEFDDVLGHNLVPVAATFSCGKDGYAAHYKCSYEDCGALFLDDAGTQSTTLTDLEREATGEHNFETTLPAVPCTNEESHGTAGIETCTNDNCGFSKSISQHDYTVKSVVKNTTCKVLGTYNMLCERCGAKETDEDGKVITYKETEYRPHTDMGTPIYHARVEKTCFTDGNIAYWTCKTCEKNFKEANMQNEILLDAAVPAGTVIPASHGEGVDYSTVATTCGGEYHIAQKQCEDCEAWYWTMDNKSDIQEGPITYTAAHLSALALQPGWATDCEGAGQKDTYLCESCPEGANLYLDEEGTILANETNMVIPQLSHNGVYKAAKEASCRAEGNYAYYTACTNGCGKIYKANEDGTINTAEWFADLAATKIEKLNHVTEVVPAVESVCNGNGGITKGNIEYHKCTACGKKFDTENASGYATPLSNTAIVDDTPHVPNHAYVDGTIKVLSTCTKEGYYAMTCTADECGDVYYQFTAPLLHNVTVKNETYVAPECIETGMHVFYYCANCEKSYTDADCTILTTVEGVEVVYDELVDAVIPATGVHYNMVEGVKVEISTDCSIAANRNNANRVCVECEATFALAHNMVAASTASNCKYPESTYQACSICQWIDESTRVVTGEKNGVHPVDALDWAIDSEAACGVAGSKHQYCKLCNETIAGTENTEIPALTHNPVEVSRTNATCIEDGVINYECEYCHTPSSETIPANGNHVHDDANWVDRGLENKYTLEDAEENKCVNCDHKEYRAKQDINFTVSIDNGVVAGTEIVNSGKVAVTVMMSAFEKAANAFQLSFNYSDNLSFEKVVFADNTVFNEGNGNDETGVCTLFTMKLSASDFEINGQDIVYATVYFVVDADKPADDETVAITDLTVNQMLTTTTDITEITTVGADVSADVEWLGDVNCDGVIDLRDVQAVMALVNAGEYSALADFDKDGGTQVSVADFAALRKYFATTYTYEQLINPDLR